MSHSEIPPVSPVVAAWLHQCPDHAIIVLDPAGTVQEWLGGAERVLGYTAPEAIGRNIALIFTREDKERGYPGYELKVASEDSFSEDSRWHIRKDGTRIWVTGSVSPVRAADGGLLGFVKVLRDMTDQRAQTERFEHEVGELGEVRENTRLFLRKLGHEIRNPLAVLANTVHILERIVTDERGAKAARQLGNQLGILKHLADELMDVSRLELGKVEIKKERFDLSELLADVVEGMQQQAAGKSIHLEALLLPSALFVDADFSRIQQVCVNLIDNAIKYTHAEGSVWVKVSQEGNEIVCRIQDTGIGIFPPVLPKLFDLFTQAPHGQEMRAGGIGVGLALVRQLVELHGGTVQAKSPGLGKGSEFVFRLPAIVAESAGVDAGSRGSERLRNCTGQSKTPPEGGASA